MFIYDKKELTKTFLETWRLKSMAATIQDVAKAAGVSVGTVSRAKNYYPDNSAKTRERILDVAKELKYRPNLVAKSLSSKHSRNIALILSGFLEDVMFNDFETMLMKGCYQFAIEHDLDISMYVINTKTQAEKSYEQLCYEHNIAGAVIFGLKNTDPYFKSLEESRKPCVTIDVEVSGENVSNVTNDHKAAFEELTQYLIDQGHRKIALVCGRENAAVTAQRMEGALSALHKNGLALPKELIIYTNFLKEEASEGVARFLKDGAGKDVTAFLCMSDMLAIGTIEALKMSGERVPQDYSVVGYDGLYVTEYTDPKITTVDQNIKDKGYEAANLLYDMIEGIRPAQDLILPHKLEIRDSVRQIDA